MRVHPISLKVRRVLIPILGAVLAAFPAALSAEEVQVKTGGKLIVNSTLTLPAGGIVEVESGGQTQVADTGVVEGDVQVSASGVLYLCGQITGALVNHGDVVSDCGGIALVQGSASNTGELHLRGGSSLVVNGALTNSGLLDVLTGGALSPGSLINTGVLLDAGQLSRDLAITRDGAGTGIEITLDTLTDHHYQLQTTGDLASDWHDLGDPFSGPGLLQHLGSGILITLPSSYYRVVVTE